MSQSSPRSLAGCAVLALFAGPVSASPLTYAFSGTVTELEVNGPALDPSVAVGAGVWGTYTIESTSTCVNNPGVLRICYHQIEGVPPYGVSLTIGTTAFVPLATGPGTAPTTLDLRDNGAPGPVPPEYWSLSDRFLLDAAGESWSFGWALIGDDTELVHGFAIDQIPDLAHADSNTASITRIYVSAGGTIGTDRIAMVFGAPALVPEPGTWALVAAGFAALAACRSRQGPP